MNKAINFPYFILLVCFSTALVLVGVPAGAASQFRDLVFEDQPAEESQPTGEPSVTTGVKITLELERDGKTSRVLPTHTFRTGDRVKLIYTTNIDCYVYWMAEGTSGEYYMLFPNPKVGMDNWVKKNTAYTIPAKDGATFKFKEPKGVEKILLIMSPQKMPDLEEAAEEAAVKGGRVSDNSNNVAAVKKKHDDQVQTRDLVFEDQSDQNTGVVTKTQVSPDITQPFVINLELVHQ